MTAELTSAAGRARHNLTVGQALIALLERAGVTTVFGIPGVHTVELYRGLDGSSITHVTPRHEQGAAFMADGFSRATGRPGICLLITGPGLTNAATAMAQALADRIPMLVITGVNPIATWGAGQGRLHELADQTAFARTVALDSFTLRRADELGSVFESAWRTMRTGRPGPVHLQIPTDVMGQTVRGDELSAGECTAPDASLGESQIAPTSMQVSPAVIERAAGLCAGARRPLVIVGGGAVGAGEAVRLVAEQIDAPVLTTANARGLLHGHALNVPASASLRAIHQAINEADLVLACGTEWGQTDFDVYETGHAFNPARLIRVDIDTAQLQSGPAATLGVEGCAASFLADLSGALARGALARGALGSGALANAGRVGGHGALEVDAARDRANEMCGTQRAAHLRRAAMDEVGAAYCQLIAVLDAIWTAQPDARLVGDSTQLTYAGNLYVDAPRPRAWFNSATGFGTLGYGPPAAIGAALGDPASPVVCLVGDGGLQFTMAELSVARETGARVIFLVWNNHGYKEIRTYMQAAGVAPIGVTPQPPDLELLARACGLGYAKAATLDAVIEALAAPAWPMVLEINEAQFLADPMIGKSCSVAGTDGS